MFDQDYYYKLLLFFIFCILLLLSFNLAKAQLLLKAQITNLQFSVVDFVAPPSPDLIFPAAGQLLAGKNQQFTWERVSDFENTHPVIYKIQIDEGEIKITENSSWEITNLEAGEHLWRVKACDSLDNCSLWTEGNFISDGEAPQVFLQYGDFIAQEKITTDNFSFNNQPPIKNLSFAYRVTSEENLPGFDEISYQVLLNNRLVFRLGAGDKSTSFKTAYLDLSQFKDDPQLELKFVSKDSGDDLRSTQVEIKDLTTNLLVLREDKDYQIIATDNYDSQPTVFSERSGELINFWATDAAGNESERRQSKIIVDQVAPANLGEIQVFAEGNNEYYLQFMAGTDNLGISNYQLSAGFEFLADPYFKFVLPPASNTRFSEDFLLKKVDQNLQSLEFELCDVAGNCSVTSLSLP